MTAMDNGLTAFSANGSSNSWDEAPVLSAGQIGLWVFLASITMLFAGFTSAIFVRRTAADWQPMVAPGLLWLNTAFLLSSSITIERVRGFVRLGRWQSARVWLLGTTLLGVLFLAGQIAVWRELVARGVYLSGNPHSAFFYILTGAHAVHLAGGLAALAYLLARFRSASRNSASESSLKLCATYWHFLDGLWIYLFVVLFVF